MGATHLCILSVVVLLQFFVGSSLACVRQMKASTNLNSELNFLFYFISFHFNFAQNGFNIRLDEINNCAGPDQVITIDSNSTIQLTPDCKLVIVGCVTTTGFEKADVGKHCFESEYCVHSLAFRISGEIYHHEKGLATNQRTKRDLR